MEIAEVLCGVNGPGTLNSRAFFFCLKTQQFYFHFLMTWTLTQFPSRRKKNQLNIWGIGSRNFSIFKEKEFSFSISLTPMKLNGLPGI